MKKTLIILFVIVLCLSVFIGCENKQEIQESSDKETSELENTEDIFNEPACDYIPYLSVALDYIKKTDISFDINKHRISVKHFNDNNGLLSLDYFISDDISTDKSIIFELDNDSIISVTYDKALYADEMYLADEQSLIDIVNAHKEQNDVSLKEDPLHRSYYTYSYRTGELKFIEEIYQYDDDNCLSGNMKETILN